MHRIGRTARAGKTGKALSVSSEFDYDSLAKLERYLKYKIPVIQPEARFLENVSFVRIVRVDREDGADHVRSGGRGDKRHVRGERGASRGRGPERGRGRQGAGAGERPPRRDHAHAQGPKPEQGERPAGRDQQKRYGEDRGAYMDTRRAKGQQHTGKGGQRHDRRPEHKNKKDTFAIVPRSPAKAGLFSRIGKAIKSLFTRKKSEPQISERTRRILEQEQRGGGDHKRGPKQGRRRPGGHRKGGRGDGAGGQRRR